MVAVALTHLHWLVLKLLMHSLWLKMKYGGGRYAQYVNFQEFVVLNMAPKLCCNKNLSLSLPPYNDNGDVVP
jgi:hypothetical protein